MSNDYNVDDAIRWRAVTGIWGLTHDQLVMCMKVERAAIERIAKAMSEIEELARDAQAEWRELEPFSPRSEYERGYMNAMHQALNLIKRCEHKEQA